MPQAPLVSIVICAYNAGLLLGEAVDSALAQTWPKLEVLVVDDGSTDGSFRAIESISDPRLRILHHTNRGKPASLNRALEELGGEFYAILDADDRCSPERVARQAAAMIEDPELSAVFCGIELILNGRVVAPRFSPRDPESCQRDLEALRMPGHDPSGMFRTSLARKVRYREECRVAQGLDFILRLGEIAPRMRVLGECLYQYRIHSASITKADPAFRIQAVYEVQKAACERRGLPPPPEPGPASRYRNRDRDNNLAAHFMESVLDLRRSDRLREALGVGIACARLHPLDPHYWKAFVYALLPTGVTESVRRRVGSEARS